MKRSELLKKWGIEIPENFEDSEVNFEGYIPKSRFDEINNTLKETKESLTTKEKEITELMNSSKDIETLKTDWATKEAKWKEDTEKLNKSLKMNKINSEAKLKLIEKGAKYPDLLMNNMAKDLETLNLTDDGKIIGLDDIINKSYETFGDLFGKETLTGKTPPAKTPTDEPPNPELDGLEKGSWEWYAKASQDEVNNYMNSKEK